MPHAHTRQIPDSRPTPRLPDPQPGVPANPAKTALLSLLNHTITPKSDLIMFCTQFVNDNSCQLHRISNWLQSATMQCVAKIMLSRNAQCEFIRLNQGPRHNLPDFRPKQVPTDKTKLTMALWPQHLDLPLSECRDDYFMSLRSNDCFRMPDHYFTTFRDIRSPLTTCGMSDHCVWDTGTHGTYDLYFRDIRSLLTTIQIVLFPNHGITIYLTMYYFRDIRSLFPGHPITLLSGHPITVSGTPNHCLSHYSITIHYSLLNHY